MKNKTIVVSEKLCEGCPAICCKTLAMEIGRPVNRVEVEELKWQLRFDTVKVYIHNRRWHQLVEGRCMYLDKDDRCTVYEERPDKCRKHNPTDCERYGPFYDLLISTPDELEEYWESKKRKKKKKSSEKPLIAV